MAEKPEFHGDHLHELNQRQAKKKRALWEHKPAVGQKSLSGWGKPRSGEAFAGTERTKEGHRADNIKRAPGTDRG